MIEITLTADGLIKVYSEQVDPNKYETVGDAVDTVCERAAAAGMFAPTTISVEPAEITAWGA